MVKKLVVTGGTASSLGKGTLTTSLARLLQELGYNVSMLKIDNFEIDNYIKKRNPNKSGERYILKDGSFVDMDFFYYSKNLDVNLNHKNHLTTAKINRKMDKTGDSRRELVEEWIDKLVEEEDPDFLVTEIGGTVGEPEQRGWLDIFREKKVKDDFCHVHLGYSFFDPSEASFKTKPTQLSLRRLEELNFPPDLLVMRLKGINHEQIHIDEGYLKDEISEVERKIADRYHFISEESIFHDLDAVKNKESTVFRITKSLSSQGILKPLWEESGIEYDLEKLEERYEEARDLHNSAVWSLPPTSYLVSKDKKGPRIGVVSPISVGLKRIMALEGGWNKDKLQQTKEGNMGKLSFSNKTLLECLNDSNLGLRLNKVGGKKLEDKIVELDKIIIPHRSGQEQNQDLYEDLNERTTKYSIKHGKPLLSIGSLSTKDSLEAIGARGKLLKGGAGLKEVAIEPNSLASKLYDKKRTEEIFPEKLFLPTRLPANLEVTGVIKDGVPAIIEGKDHGLLSVQYIPSHNHSVSLEKNHPIFSKYISC